MTERVEELPYQPGGGGERTKEAHMVGRADEILERVAGDMQHHGSHRLEVEGRPCPLQGGEAHHEAPDADAVRWFVDGSLVDPRKPFAKNVFPYRWEA